MGGKRKRFERRPVPSCPIHNGCDTARLGEHYYIVRTDEQEELGQIEEIEATGPKEYLVKMRAYEKASRYPLPEWRTGHNEYALTSRRLTVSSECLANKVNVLPWEQYASSPADTRRCSLFYRLQEQGISSSSKYDLLMGVHLHADVRLCACCKERFNPDCAWTYCTHCYKVTIDEHIRSIRSRALPGTDSSFLRQETTGLHLVSKTAGSSVLASCPGCRRPYSHEAVRWTPSPPNSLENAPPDYYILVDAGTGGLRISAGTSLKELKLLKTIASIIFVPDDGEAELGTEGRHRKGMPITPVKRLFFPNGRTESDLNGKDPHKIMRAAWAKGITNFLNNDMCPEPDQKLRLWIGATYPCCFASSQRSTYLTAFQEALHDCKHVPRVIGMTEATAAFFSLLARYPNLEADTYLLCDAGATTIDFVLVNYQADGEVTVHDDFGLPYGTDWPETTIAATLAKNDQSVSYVSHLTAVREYGLKIKQQETITAGQFDTEMTRDYGPLMDEFYNKLRNDLKRHASIIACRDKFQKVLLCGGGARSTRFRNVIEEELGPAMYSNTSDRESHVLKGVEMKMERLVSGQHNHIYAPVSICLEQDVPGSSTDKELLVLYQESQALAGPKISDMQMEPDVPVVLDVDLGEEPACLTFKGCFEPVECRTNDRGLLVAVDKPTDPKFYEIGEITYPSEVWRGNGEKGFELLQVRADFDAGVLKLRDVLFRKPENASEADQMEQRMLKQSIDETVSEYNSLLIKQKTMVVSLDLNEVHRRHTASIPNEVQRPQVAPNMKIGTEAPLAGPEHILPKKRARTVSTDSKTENRQLSEGTAKQPVEIRRVRPKRSNRSTNAAYHHTGNGPVPPIVEEPSKGSVDVGLGIPWNRPVQFEAGRQRASVNFEGLARLAEGNWLNDELINFYMIYLYQQANIPLNKVHFFNTHFFTALTANTSNRKGPIDYAAVSRWTTGKDIFKYDYIVVPVCESMHWHLAIICNATNVLRKPMLTESDQSSPAPKPHSEPPHEPQLVSVEDKTDTSSRSPRTGNERIGATTGQGAGVDVNLFDDERRVTCNDPQTELVESVTVQRSPPVATIRIQCHSNHDIPKDILRDASLSSRSSMTKDKRRLGPAMEKFDTDAPIILILDSLGRSHPKTVGALKHYVFEEGSAKHGMEADITQDAFYVGNAHIPMQRNNTDCGAYLLVYVAKFLADPRGFVTKILTREMDCETDWSSMSAPLLRKEMREILQGLYKRQEEGVP